MRCLLLGLLIGCSTSTTPQTTTTVPALDCAALGSATDCWPAFVASVEACIGEPVWGGLDIDNRSCGTADRGVSFHTPALAKAQHFTVTNAGRKCLEWTREEGETAFIAVSGTSTFRLTNTNEIICPDGKRFTLKAESCADKLPGGVYESSSYVQLKLNGREKPVFRCDFVDGTRDAATGG
jgi:hypothetical protein